MPVSTKAPCDEAEQWLRDNDPEYKQRRRSWTAPTTDALTRALAEVNEPHSSLDGLSETTPSGRGHYRRSVPTDGKP